MKFGYLREDDDGHDYLIPEELIKEFDSDQERLSESNFTWEEREDFNAEWNDKWWQYALGESYHSYKVVMPE